MQSHRQHPQVQEEQDRFLADLDRRSLSSSKVEVFLVSNCSSRNNNNNSKALASGRAACLVKINSHKQERDRYLVDRRVRQLDSEASDNSSSSSKTTNNR